MSGAQRLILEEGRITGQVGLPPRDHWQGSQVGKGGLPSLARC